MVTLNCTLTRPAEVTRVTSLPSLFAKRSDGFMYWAGCPRSVPSKEARVELAIGQKT